jgi:hypothetical protein
MRELTDMELDAVSGGDTLFQSSIQCVSILITGSFNVNFVQQVQQSNTSSTSG